MIGSPASFISMASTGQALWQRAPQAMHFPSRRQALPRGFLIGFFASVMKFLMIRMHGSSTDSIRAQRQRSLTAPADPCSAACRSAAARSPPGRCTPSPMISPLSRSGEKILLTQVGDPLRPMVLTSSFRTSLFQTSTSRFRGRQPHRHGRVARPVDLPHHGDHGRQRRLDDLVPPFQLAPHP